MGSETIFHIDVNSAYLSWSAIRRLQNGDPLDLRTIPSIIGGDQEKRHGIVLAKSIPARNTVSRPLSRSSVLSANVPLSSWKVRICIIIIRKVKN